MARWRRVNGVAAIAVILSMLMGLVGTRSAYAGVRESAEVQRVVQGGAGATLLQWCDMQLEVRRSWSQVEILLDACEVQYLVDMGDRVGEAWGVLGGGSMLIPVFGQNPISISVAALGAIQWLGAFGLNAKHEQCGKNGLKIWKKWYMPVPLISCR